MFSRLFSVVSRLNEIASNVADVPSILNTAVNVPSEVSCETIFEGLFDVSLALTVNEEEDGNVVCVFSALVCVFPSSEMSDFSPRCSKAVEMRRHGRDIHPHVGVSTPPSFDSVCPLTNTPSSVLEEIEGAKRKWIRGIENAFLVVIDSSTQNELSTV